MNGGDVVAFPLKRKKTPKISYQPLPEASIERHLHEMNRARTSLIDLNPEAAGNYIESLPDGSPAVRLAALGERVRLIEGQIRHLNAIRKFLRQAWEDEWDRLEGG